MRGPNFSETSKSVLPIHLSRAGCRHFMGKVHPQCFAEALGEVVFLHGGFDLQAGNAVLHKVKNSLMIYDYYSTNSIIPAVRFFVKICKFNYSIVAKHFSMDTLKSFFYILW